MKTLKMAGASRPLAHGVMYAAYVRNYDERGDFAALTEDLERIRALGVDILWLLPVHPIGKERRKGNLGSPYAIADYREINPEYGDVHDFKALVDRAHEVGLKVFLDVVFNHTAPDARLYREHPDYYYRDPEGQRGNRIGEWADVVDLDHRSEGLEAELIDVLVKWAAFGIDGFRCDVAPLVPLRFWKKAREAVTKVNADCVWLAETFDGAFEKIVRGEGIDLPAEKDLAEVFDLIYDYDTYETYRAFLAGQIPLSAYVDALEEQAGRAVQGSLRLKFLENHDQPRAKALIGEDKRLVHWTAMKYLERGTMLLYNGQEAMDAHQVSLFDRDPVDWSGLDRSYVGLLNRLYHLKQDPLIAKGIYSIEGVDGTPVVKIAYTGEERRLEGYFCLEPYKRTVPMAMSDGEIENLIDGEIYRVKKGKLKLKDRPVWFEIKSL